MLTTNHNHANLKFVIISTQYHKHYKYTLLKGNKKTDHLHVPFLQEISEIRQPCSARSHPDKVKQEINDMQFQSAVYNDFNGTS